MAKIIVDDEIKEVQVVKCVQIFLGGNELVFNLHESEFVNGQRRGKYFITEEYCGRTVLYVDNVLSAKKELIKLINKVGQKIFVENIQSYVPVNEHVNEFQQRTNSQQCLSLFKKMTGLPVQLDRVMLMVGKVCVDVIALDEAVCPDDGQSLLDAINVRFGQDAVTLLQDLI
jgi:glycerol-3-phosphate cytidylyltransferase-like family protein